MPASTASLELVAGVAGGSGYNDGPAATAAFGFPEGVAVDASGTIYIGDGTVLRAIRAGVVSTVAGAPGASGFVDGKAGAARFGQIGDIAVDPAGNVLVADPYNNAVRRVTPDGVVTTLAGGTAGYQDGPAAQARFSTPLGVSADLAGNVYVADADNCVIRKIDTAGVVSTVAGIAGQCRLVDGAAGQGSLTPPHHVAVGAAGDLFIGSYGWLRRLDVNRTLSTLAPGQFSVIEGLAVDRTGVLYVSDAGQRMISRIAAGESTASIISGGSSGVVQDGPRATATYADPLGIALVPGGLLVVAEGQPGVVRELALDSLTVATIAGTPPWLGGDVNGPAQQARFNTIEDLAADSAGNVYIAEYNGIRRLTPAGVVDTFASGFPAGPDTFGQPPSIDSIAVDSHDALFAATTEHCGTGRGATACHFQVWHVSSASQVSSVCPLDWTAVGLAVGPNGDFFAGYFDRGLARVGVSTCARFQSVGESSSQFIHGIAVDSAGNAYAVDEGSHVILRVTPGGVSTFAGQSLMPGYADGPASKASFKSPTDVAIDNRGNLYVADTGNDVVRKITPDGQVSTIAGTPGRSGFVAGPLPGVLHPTSLAIVGNDLYIGVGTAIARIRNVP
jgi:hypothetical protein